jgi:lipopolysaccharide/colanic/teichoic acid biosynthesis glycosyltransferase
MNYRNFINARKGEMSVAGQRPERPYFVHEFLHGVNDNDRHVLKFGGTGWTPSLTDGEAIRPPKKVRSTTCTIGRSGVLLSI